MLIEQVKRPGVQSALDLSFFIIQMCELYFRSLKSIDFQHSFIKQIFVENHTLCWPAGRDRLEEHRGQ